MKLWKNLRAGARFVFFRKRFETDMADEMKFHLEHQEALHRAAGLSETEARYAAARQFGHVDSLQEKCREQTGALWLDLLAKDVRFGWRMLRKAPGYTIVVVLTLGLGIGANCTLFGMVSSMFFDNLAFDRSGRLVVAAQRQPEVAVPIGISYLDFKDYAARLKQLDEVTVSFPSPVQIGFRGRAAERTWGAAFSPNTFEALGIRPQLGRVILPSDGDAPGSSQVVVLSDAYWKSHYNADPDVIGQKLQINGHPFTVVGVAERGFRGPYWSMSFDLFFPAGAASLLVGNDYILTSRGYMGWRLVGRLRPGASLAAARAEYVSVSEQLAHDFPEEHRGQRGVMYSERQARPDITVAEYTPFLILLFSGLALLVLAISCANVVSLSLARVIARRKELVMRAAIGASRWQLMRQLILESMLIALIAGGVGYILSMFMGQLFTQFRPGGDVPIFVQSGTNWRPAVFTVALSLLAGFITGVIPAWRASRIDLSTALNESANVRASGDRRVLQSLLVISQVTASFVVLIAAVAFARGLRSAERVALGFRPDHLLVASYDVKLQGYSDAQALHFAQDLVRRAEQLSDVTDATVASNVPFDYATHIADMLPEATKMPEAEPKVSSGYAVVAPSYFATLGVAIQEGRGFEESDSEKTKPVALVNRAFAERCWPGQSALGKKFRRWKGDPLIEIVGVTGTGKYMMVSEPERPFVYLPLAQAPIAPLSIVLRTRGRPESAAFSLQRLVQELDSDLPVYGVRSMDELMNSSVFAFMPLRMGALLATMQGIIALLLAVLGLYSLVAYGVNQRVREIGIRMAMGAQSSQVLSLVTWSGIRLTLCGTCLGVLLAFGVSRAMSRVIYGVQGWDPVSYSLVAVLLFATTLCACYWPARRATHVDPVEALRRD